MSVYYPNNGTWGYSSSSTLYVHTAGNNSAASGVLQMPVQVAPAPKPATEIERLLADVDAVCALARAV